MSRVTMPQYQTDSLGKAMQVYQAAKSVYDMKNGNATNATQQAAEGGKASTAGTVTPKAQDNVASTSENPMVRRLSHSVGYA